MTLPWLKFSPVSWRGDEKLRAVSIAARGFWIECMCIMHTAKPYGHLLLNGEQIDDVALSRMTGASVDEARALLAELRKADVCGVTSKGIIFSRRMVADHAKSQKGRKSANRRWSQVSDDEGENAGPIGVPTINPSTKREEVRQEGIPPKSPKARAASPRGSGHFFAKAEMLRNDDETGSRSDRHDVGGLPVLAIGDQRSDG